MDWPDLLAQPKGRLRVFNDVTSVALTTAIAGLSERQRVSANNIANIETPGFQASTVSFEASLADALGSGRPGDARISTAPTGDPSGQNGNNVNLETELVTATETGLQEKLLTNTITSHFGWMSTVLKG